MLTNRELIKQLQRGKDAVMAQYKLHKSITERRVLRAVERQQTSLDNPGFCLACGIEAHGCEPDARRYECESCGMKAVYGAEWIMMANFYWPNVSIEAKAQG